MIAHKNRLGIEVILDNKGFSALHLSSPKLGEQPPKFAKFQL